MFVDQTLQYEFTVYTSFPCGPSCNSHQTGFRPVSMRSLELFNCCTACHTPTVWLPAKPKIQRRSVPPQPTLHYTSRKTWLSFFYPRWCSLKDVHFLHFSTRDSLVRLGSISSNAAPWPCFAAPLYSNYSYCVSTPVNYDAKSTYPALVFLSGSGASGNLSEAPQISAYSGVGTLFNSCTEKQMNGL